MQVRAITCKHVQLKSHAISCYFKKFIQLLAIRECKYKKKSAQVQNLAIIEKSTMLIQLS